MSDDPGTPPATDPYPHISPVDLPGAGLRALKGAALRSGGYVAALALALISTPILIRYLGVAAYGRYSTVIAVTAVVGGLTDAGLTTVAVREWTTRHPQAARSLFAELMVVRLALSLAAIGVGVAFALVVGYPDVMVIGSLLVGIALLLTAFSHLLGVPLQAELRFGSTALLDLLRQTTATVLTILLVVLAAPLVQFFAVQIAAAAATLVAAGWLARRWLTGQKLAAGWQSSKSLLAESLPYGVAVGISTLYLRVPLILMSLISSAHATGEFATSFRVIEVLVGVPALAFGAGFPLLARAAHSNLARFNILVAQFMKLGLAGGALAALSLALLAPWITAVLAGSGGHGATPVLEIQSAALLGTSVSGVAGLGLLALRRHRTLLMANVAALAVNLAAGAALISADAAVGAALAAVAAELVLTAVQVGALWRYGSRRLGLRSWVRVAIALVAGTIPIWTIGSTALRTVCGLLLFAAVFAATGGLRGVSVAVRVGRADGS